MVLSVVVVSVFLSVLPHLLDDGLLPGVVWKSVNPSLVARRGAVPR